MDHVNNLISLVEYELSFDGDTSPYWKVARIWIDETISGMSHATIDAAIEVDFITDINTDDLLGADVALSMSRVSFKPEHFFGVVARVDVLSYTDDILSLRFRVVSVFELLQQVTDSRIWQGATPMEIVEEVLTRELAAYGRSFDATEVTRGSAAREYCVQYRESMRNFVMRLLEEEGISFYFVHDPETNKEVLTLADSNDRYALTSSNEGAALPLIPTQAEFLETESIQEFEENKALTSTAVLRRDFDWKSPENLLSASADGVDLRGRTRRLYLHGDRRFSADDLDERAADRRAAAAMSTTSYDGSSNALGLRAGSRFELRGHTSTSLDREYIVLEARHSGGHGLGSPYVNDFTCIPADIEIRPTPSVPKPRTNGPQTAIVTGDEEIHIDEFGRVQVQFGWEEDPTYAAHSSCWIRCMQSWAGRGWGAQFIPRVGMEVVVEFLEGNPDRPLVVGCVYDGSREFPFTVPDDKTQSGLRTRSSPDSEGFNELRFEDAAGAEEIYVHAERDLRTEVEANELRTVGGSRTTSITDDDGRRVSEGDVTLTIEAGSRITEIAKGDDTTTVAKGGVTKSVPSGTDLVEAKEVVLRAADKIRLECGASAIEMTPKLIEIKSALIKLN